MYYITILLYMPLYITINEHFLDKKYRYSTKITNNNS